MAKINIYNNCFEENFKTIDFDKNKSLISQIEENVDFEKYEKDLVECYDPETGKTFYAPLEEKSKPSVIININGKLVDENYKVKDDDVVNVVFIPMGEHFGEKFGYAWNGGVAGGISAGILLASLIPGVGHLTAALIVGAGFLVGGLLGYSAGSDIVDAKYAKTTNKGQKEGDSLPDIKGAANKSLLNNPYPFVIGKRLVTPFIIGDPYTEYTNNGKDAYIRMLYCVGYAPLKLTDFKLGDFMLAYNRSQGTSRNTILSGLLKGYSTEAADDGDILDRWKNNEIELEILQYNPNKAINHGDIYPDVKIEKEINANILFVNDDSLAEQAEVVYKGISFAERFRTNTVVFTESCPMEFTVNLDAPNGLYETHTHTSKNNNNTTNETVYNSIPLWYALQWRFYNENNDSSDSEGSDYSQWNNINGWNGNTDVLQLYDSTAHAADIAAHKGNNISYDITTKRVDTVVNFNNLISEITSLSSFSNYSTSLIVINNSIKLIQNGLAVSKSLLSFQYIEKGNKEELSDSLYWGRLTSDTTLKRYCAYDSETETLWIDLTYNGDTVNNTLTSKVNSAVISYNLGEGQAVTLYTYNKVKNSVQTDTTGTTETVNVKYIKTTKKYYKSSMGDYCTDTGFWINKQLINLQAFSGENNIGETRLSATVSLTKEQCKEMLENSNRIKGIEIRCIRVSPNYINEQESSSSASENENDGAESYSDSIVLKTVVTKQFNKDVLEKENIKEPVKAISDDDIKKFCYIALKAKADVAGNILNQVKELNCIAESFSPVYNETSHSIVPEGVHKVTKYYGYYTDSTRQTKSNRTSDAYEYYLGSDDTARLAYEEGRHEGFNWYAEKAGSNYVEKIDEIVFPSDDEYYTTHNYKPCNLLPPEAEFLNDSTAASGFMLSLVGSHNGTEAKGYEDINILSFIDTWEAQQKVTDGSTYSESDNEHSAGDIVEVKFEANGYVYQSQKLEDLLKKVATAGRFVYTYDEKGVLKMIMDNPVDYPVGCLTQQNIISLSSAYTYEELPAGLRISFNDEKDGYENNGIYCWSDGNNINNYKGQVQPYSLDFVTKDTQAWSLGRYFLANLLLNREVLTVKGGVEGNGWELGNVIKLQSNDILVGKGAGRIQQIIEDDDYIYGFITDSTFTYTDETEIIYDEEKSKFGFSVYQQKKIGDKTASFRMAAPGKQCTVDEVTYIQTVGETNLMLLDEEISKSQPNVYSFSLNDILMFGYFNRETEQYRITKIKPEKNNFTYTLIKYNPDIYNYGRALPSFQNYMTIPNPTKDGITLSEVPTTISEMKDESLDNTTYLMNTQERVISLTSLSDVGNYIGQLGLYQTQLYKWNGTSWENTSAILPTDPVLHYSFDEVPDLPDGTSTEKFDKNLTTDGWSQPSGQHRGTFSANNGILRFQQDSASVSGNAVIRRQSFSYSDKIGFVVKVRAKVHKDPSLTNTIVIGIGSSGYVTQTVTEFDKFVDYYFVIPQTRPTSWTSDAWNIAVNFGAINTNNYFEIEQLYIGNGSYNTPIIDNANGQNNAENHGGLATEGVSGKAVRFLGNGYLRFLSPRETEKFTTYTFSYWIKNWDKSQLCFLANNRHIGGYSAIYSRLSASANTALAWILQPDGKVKTYTWDYPFSTDNLIEYHIVFINNNGVPEFYINGKKLNGTSTATFSINEHSEYIDIGRSNTGSWGYSVFDLDDFTIYDRVLSEEEVIGLYLAKGNTPKYYSISDYQLESIDDDGVISPIEKQNLLSTWKQIYNAVNVSANLPTTSPVANGGEYKGVIDEANSLNIINTTKITAYIQSANELRSALWNVTNGYLLNMQSQSTVRTDINLDTILANYRTALQDARTAIGQQQSAIASALGVSNSNPFCLIPVNATTGNPNYENTGTTLQLFNGTTELTPIISGTLADNQWKVTASGTHISQSINGTIPTGTKQIVYGNVSAFAANETNATVTYTIQARINGVTNTIYTTQKFAKAQEGADGRIYDLRTENGTIVKSPTGNLTPSTVTVKAYSWTASNSPALFASGDLKAFENGVQIGSTVSQGSSITVTPSGNYPVLVQLLKHGTNTILDEMNIPVLTEVKGDKGDTGASVGNQILRGTNTTFTELVPLSSSTWANKKWRKASTSTDNRTVIDITDCPDPNIVKGVNILGGNTSVDHISQDAVPLLSGVEYTMSCWAKADSLTHTPKLNCQWWKDSSHSGSTNINLTTEWKKYSFTFTPNVDTPNIYFGGRYASTDTTTNIKICGMKVELGNTATDWCEYEYDKNGKKIKISDYTLRTWSADNWTSYSTAGNTANWTNTDHDFAVGDILIVPAKLSSEGNIIGQSYNEVTGTPYQDGSYWRIPCKVLYGVKGEKGATGNTGKATHVSDYASTRTWTNAQWNDYSTKDRSTGWNNVTGSPTIKIGDIFIVYATLSEQGNITGQVYCEVTGITGSGSSWTITSKTLYGVKGEKGQQGAKGFSSRTIAFKPNYSAIATSSAGRIFVCGYNSSTGFEADVNGYVIISNTNTYYIKGTAYCACAADGYLVAIKSTDSSSPATPVIAYHNGTNWVSIANNGTTETTITASNYIALAKVQKNTAGSNITLEPLNPCVLTAINQPLNYYFESLVTTTSDTSASITPYEITQNVSDGTYSYASKTARYARRGAVVLVINSMSAPESATIKFYTGTKWVSVGTSHKSYRDMITLMAGILPLVAGFFVYKNQPVPLICGTYIDTLTANIAIINRLFVNKIKVGTNGSIYGGDRYDKDGNLTDPSKLGFYLGADGNMVGLLGCALTDNVLIGDGAGANMIKNTATSEGEYIDRENVYIGLHAGDYTGTHSYHENSSNVGIGNMACYDNTGTYMVGIGNNACYGSSGYGTIGIGRNACYENTGLDVVGIGRQTCYGNTGTYVVGIGNDACFGNTVDYTIGIGESACFNNKGKSVVGIGNNACTSNRGNHAIGIGFNVLDGNTYSDIISLQNQFICIRFASGTTQSSVYDFLAKYLAENTDSWVSCIGHYEFEIWKISWLNNAYRLYNSGNNVVYTVTKNSSTILGYRLDLAFLPNK